MRVSEDSRTVTKVLNGDVNAYALLVKKYQKPIYNLMYRATGSKEISMDLSQTTMIKAYENLERFDQNRKYFPWLYAIGANLAKDHLRRTNREKRYFDSKYDEDNTIDTNTDTMARIEHKTKKIYVLEAMKSLPLSQREAIILRFQKELSMREIAESLSISVSGAKMRIHRAIKELRRILQKTDIY